MANYQYQDIASFLYFRTYASTVVLPPVVGMAGVGISLGFGRYSSIGVYLVFDYSDVANLQHHYLIFMLQICNIYFVISL
jgi:hypothetical protein